MSRDTASIIMHEMISKYDEKKASQLSRYFKTGKGEYAEGDKFLGIKVPESRATVKKYKDNISLVDIQELIYSEWHEIRLTGFLLLIELYNKAIKNKPFVAVQDIISFYIKNLDRGNNWDLVDLVSYKLLGNWAVRYPEAEEIIISLASSDNNIWRQRVAIVSTLAIIRKGNFSLTFSIAEKYISHHHDLIHKATGWMLREIGKKDGKAELMQFLEKHRTTMPRIMLRYAIERFTPEERSYFMRK